MWPDAELDVFVRDTGSGAVFGPYSVETRIKYTEDADATPEAKKIGSDKGKAGAVNVHYAVVLRSGWEAGDLAVAMASRSCRTNSASRPL